ncbi:MAG: SdrD B-like domain-containing protein [Bacteroidia bacterium]
MCLQSCTPSDDDDSTPTPTTLTVKVRFDNQSTYLSNVEVFLYTMTSSNPIKDGTTNANGSYTFTDMIEGQYKVDCLYATDSFLYALPSNMVVLVESHKNTEVEAIFNH